MRASLAAGGNFGDLANAAGAAEAVPDPTLDPAASRDKSFCQWMCFSGIAVRFACAVREQTAVQRPLFTPAKPPAVFCAPPRAACAPYARACATGFPNRQARENAV